MELAFKGVDVVDIVNLLIRRKMSDQIMFGCRHIYIYINIYTSLVSSLAQGSVYKLAVSWPISLFMWIFPSVIFKAWPFKSLATFLVLLFSLLRSMNFGCLLNPWPSVQECYSTEITLFWSIDLILFWSIDLILFWSIDLILCLLLFSIKTCLFWLSDILFLSPCAIF